MNIREMTRRLKLVRKDGAFSTLLGIGPMSPMLLRASLELSMEEDFPVLFIASRNQIDKAEFGGGYVSGWDQAAFCQSIRRTASSIGYSGLYYVCRDHGGPWQRDEERRAALPEKEAMARGLASYRADVDAGFDLLHIDPTKDPHMVGAALPMELVLARTVELIEKVEAYIRERGLPPVAYEVGTEETNGGLTNERAFAKFLGRLCAALAEKGLHKPDFIVGQTGTLTRLTENIGTYSAENACSLSGIAAKYGMELKEHNSDYLSDQVLLMHPALGVGASNVAPEFGVEETRAYLTLARLERALYREGRLARAGGVLECLPRASVESGRWRKWMVGEAAAATVQDALRDARLTELITDISGHYTYEIPEVARELKDMLDRLEAANVPARRYVLDKIKRSIGRYVTCYNLRGLTSRLRR